MHQLPSQGTLYVVYWYVLTVSLFVLQVVIFIVTEVENSVPTIKIMISAFSIIVQKDTEAAGGISVIIALIVLTHIVIISDTAVTVLLVVLMKTSTATTMERMERGSSLAIVITATPYLWNWKFVLLEVTKFRSTSLIHDFRITTLKRRHETRDRYGSWYLSKGNNIDEVEKTLLSLKDFSLKVSEEKSLCKKKKIKNRDLNLSEESTLKEYCQLIFSPITGTNL